MASDGGAERGEAQPEGAQGVEIADLWNPESRKFELPKGQEAKVDGGEWSTKPFEQAKLTSAPRAFRDTENVPLSEDVEAYFKREVLPHAPDAWIDDEKSKVGYEIPFNRHFYVFEPPRELAVIDAELKQTTDSILKMIQGLSASA